MRRENASGCGRRHKGDRGDLADRSTRKELTLFSVSFISLWCFALLLFRPLVMHESYIGRAIIPHPHEREKKKSLLPVSTGRARARIRHDSSDSRWTRLVADGRIELLILTRSSSYLWLPWFGEWRR
ncbi:hypothetical protein V8C43DRAFT_320146 [Trichoderma afarasin]